MPRDWFDLPRDWFELLYSPAFTRLGESTLAALLLIYGKWIWDERSDSPEIGARHERLWQCLFVHVIVAAAFIACTFVAVGDWLSVTALRIAWLAIWSALGLATLATWCMSALPRPVLSRLLQRHWVGLPAAFGVGAAAVCAGWLAGKMWKPLSLWTIWLVHHSLELLGAEAVSDPAAFKVGTKTFEVTITATCSGYQGIGLICVFLATYLWLFRRDFRFPQAFLLFPIGALVIWCANVLRVLVLVQLGTRVSAELALEGFHSQAGWLAFLAVGLGLVVIAQHMRYFSTAAPVEPASTHSNPTAAYVVPLLALLVASMLSRAFSADFDHGYPIRVLAVAVVLWWYWPRYTDLRWTWSWQAIAIGILAFAIWIGLERTPADGGNYAMPDELASLPAVWATAWLSLRVLGSVITVPLAEELAFRGYLIRRLVSADFEKVAPGQYSWLAFLLSSAAFGILHQGRFLAGAVAGMLYALALRRRGEIADAVVAHATTNALIAVYVLATGSWSLW
jgi:exosortase E/protease (VPEID-CTERM system)